MNTTVREVEQRIRAHRQLEGAGFSVRRPIPNLNIEQIDPFLLIDELGPIDYAPGAALGAPDHPHRGFETVTYALAGEFEHEDSAGHRGLLRAGDVQWMTAGAGIIHSEEPSKRIRNEGGRVHGFQIWINLPARLKMTTPRYQELKRESIPEAFSADAKAHVRVIAGNALGVSAALETHTPITFQDWTLKADADVHVPLAPDARALVYVFAGEARIGNREELVNDGELAVFGAGDTVRLRGPAAGQAARLLLLAGAPLGEPVARYGPFVMNTRAEILQAFQDYQSGRLGEITRTAQGA